jgi:hypothetical protein
MVKMKQQESSDGKIKAFEKIDKLMQAIRHVQHNSRTAINKMIVAHR